MEERIKKILHKNFTPSTMEVINESHLHAGHEDFVNTNETHFKIKVTANCFDNLSRVDKHRMIYKALNDLFQEGLHSVVIVD